MTIDIKKLMRELEEQGIQITRSDFPPEDDQDGALVALDEELAQLETLDAPAPEPDPKYSWVENDPILERIRREREEEEGRIESRFGVYGA